MNDVQLSKHFRLYELPHGELYTPAQVQELRRTVGTVLEPIRKRWGRVALTSGLYWSSGEARTGAHAHPGTVDFVPVDASIDEVFEWAALHLAGNYGQLIHERDHLHVTAPGTPIPYPGGRPRHGETWIEPVEGSYQLGAALPLAPLAGLALLALLVLALAVTA